MASIASIAIQIAANVTPFTRGMDMAKNAAQKGTADIKSAVERIDSTITGMAGNLKNALIGGGIVGAFAAIKSTLSGIHEVGNTAGTLGITTSALEALRQVAAEVQVPTETLGAGLDKLQRSIGEAANPTTEMARNFAVLGLNARELAGVPLDDAFGRFADAIRALPDPASRAAAVVSVLGKSGQGLLDVLDRGSQGFREMERSLRGAVTPEAAAIAAQTTAAFAGLERTVSIAARQLATALGPALVTIANIAQTVITNVTSLVGALSNTWSALGLLAGGIAIIRGLALAVGGLVIAVKALTAAALRNPFTALAVAAVSVLSIFVDFEAILGRITGRLDNVSSAINRPPSAAREWHRSLADAQFNAAIQIDTSSFEAAVASAQRLREELFRLGQEAAAGGGVAEVNERVRSFIRGLQMDTAAAGESPLERQLRQFQAEGANPSLLWDARQNVRLHEAQALQRSAQELLATMEQQERTVGMTAEQARILRMQEQGLRGDILDQLRVREEINRHQQQANELRRQVRTPLEQFREQWEAVQNNRFLSLDDHARQLDRLLTQFDQQRPEARSPAGALRGSREAFTAITRHELAGQAGAENQQERMRRIMEELRDTDAAQLRRLEEIRNLLRNGDVFQVAEIAG